MIHVFGPALKRILPEHLGNDVPFSQMRCLGTVTPQVASSVKTVFAEVTPAPKNMAQHFERAACHQPRHACAFNAAAHKEYDTGAGGAGTR